MKTILRTLGLLLLFSACNEETQEISSIAPVNWDKRAFQQPFPDTLESGSTYLSVYSEIFTRTEQRTHNLTATISMRNPNREDSVYIFSADYFNTSGELIRTYFEQPIYLRPMETVEIVIDEFDKAGGTGANFIFDWKKASTADDPFFEGVMISTSGQQGLSFTTTGKKLK